MFEDSLIESSGRLRTKRGWTTSFATVLLLLVIFTLCLIPMIYTEVLPKQIIATFLVAPPPPPPPPPPMAVIKVTKIETELENGALRTPTKIPEKIKIVKEEEAPPAAAAGFVPGGVTGGVPGGGMGGVIGSLIGGTGSVPKVTFNRVRGSGGVLESNLISKHIPTYPPLAKTARIQGTVILHATISNQGNEENLNVLSGHPMLAQPALEAVRQRKHEPNILNCNPAQVGTPSTLNSTPLG